MIKQLLFISIVPKLTPNQNTHIFPAMVKEDERGSSSLSKDQQ
jgi:hypothetical protein